MSESCRIAGERKTCFDTGSAGWLYGQAYRNGNMGAQLADNCAHPARLWCLRRCLGHRLQNGIAPVCGVSRCGGWRVRHGRWRQSVDRRGGNADHSNGGTGSRRRRTVRSATGGRGCGRTRGRWRCRCRRGGFGNGRRCRCGNRCGGSRNGSRDDGWCRYGGRDGGCNNSC